MEIVENKLLLGDCREDGLATIVILREIFYCRFIHSSLMQKFTIFTVLLTIVVVVVVAEIAVNEYVPGIETGGEGKLSDVLKADVSSGQNHLGADVDELAIADSKPIERVVVESIPLSNGADGINLDENLAKISELDFLPLYDEEGNTPASAASSNSSPPDFEDTEFTAPKAAPEPNVYLRDEHIKSAGFTEADLRTDSADGKLFKTIDIADLKDVQVQKYLIQTDGQLLAKVYVFKMGIQADANEIYNLLKSRMAEEPTAEINETNQYGSASFYMNDTQRAGSAFLTARIGPLIYSFSYPKEYHPQIKNLIQLLMWELG